MKPERRDFLKRSSLAVTSIVLAARAADATAQQKPAALPRLDEKDPTAAALGYVHDAAKADKKKFASWKPDQDCANCNLYQAKPTDAWGPCAIFPGKQVAAKGWCAAWVKKA